MKNTLALCFLFSLASCGKDIRRAIGADFTNKVDKNEHRIKDLERRVFNTEIAIQSNIDDMVELFNELEEMSNEGLAVNGQIFDELALTQVNINILTAQLAVLQGYDSIVEMIDPCGPSHSYDEVLLKTSSGKYVAYFEQGSKRFLTVLVDGTYQTTDEQGCMFKIIEGDYNE